MKIFFDAFWWADGPPSGRNVVRSILHEWAADYPSDEIHCWSNQAGADVMRNDMRLSSNISVEVARSPQHLVALQLRRGGQNYDASIDQNFTPLRRAARVRTVFFHDALPQARPEWFSRAERGYLGMAARLLKRADVVFTSSNAEAERIALLTSARPESIHPVGLGLPVEFANVAETKPPLAISSSRFLLTVGRLNVRKNISRLIAALRTSGQISPDRPLVIVGAPDGVADVPVLHGEPGPDTLFTGYVPDTNLRWLYAHCEAFVFPSLDEGFGLPVLEALHCGARIALSDIPSFREFGDVGEYFDPRDSHSIAAAVQRVTSTKRVQTRRQPVAGWHEVVGEMRAAIDRALEGRRL